MTNIIQKAIDIAAVAHKNQLRKGSGIPYISHPYSVGMILQQAGCKPEVIAAGILHDTLEDTDITEEFLMRQFGPVITDIVVGCSEPDKSLSWEERKAHTIEYLQTASEEVRLVACADKLHNARSTAAAIQLHGESVWGRFKRGRKEQENYYRGVVESLGYLSSFPLLDELKVEVNGLFGELYEGAIPSVDDDAMNTLFETVYHVSKETAEKMAATNLTSIADKLNEKRNEVLQRFPIPFDNPAGEYLVRRGVEFEQSEGSELLIAFCQALKETFGLYNFEMYRHFKRNMQRGIL